MKSSRTAQEGTRTVASGNGEADGSPVQAQLRKLEQASLVQLRAEWRKLFGTDPPQLSRDLLVRALAYLVQERALGGLSRASRRMLQEFARTDRTGVAPDAVVSIRPGARLVREWRGRTHVVVATDIGFDYAGSSYASLTQIARLITGAHWSGPRFFGLTDRRVRVESANV